uniref:Uncharacterized protein n=1 Tax=Rhizophora mucronata TaxID=61149 RepID=A0A2P2II24_RHIMU
MSCWFIMNNIIVHGLDVAVQSPKFLCQYKGQDLGQGLNVWIFNLKKNIVDRLRVNHLIL